MSYGFCPICGAPGKLRERRPDGDDVCEKGHTYPSRTSLREPSDPNSEQLSVDAALLAAFAAVHTAPTEDPARLMAVFHSTLRRFGYEVRSTRAA